MELNDVIHQPVRLRIMSALISLEEGSRINFVDLRDLLGVTDGNLGAHLIKLEEAGYITTEKRFIARKPCTFIGVTNKGKAAFEDYVASLKSILPSG